MMLKRFFVYVTVFSYILSTPSAFGTNVLEDILASTRPDRSAPLEYHKGPGEVRKFYEYYLLGENNECAFRGFGTNRLNAINTIKERSLRSQNLSQIIKDSIQMESWERKEAIFSRPLPTNLSRENIETYLTFYQNNPEMIECPINFLNGQQVTQTLTHSLLHALAYVFNLSVEVYTKSGLSLSLCDQFTLYNGAQKYPTVRLLHNNGHFNLLLDSNDDTKALLNEGEYLKQLEESIEKSRLEGQFYQEQNHRESDLLQTSSDAFATSKGALRSYSAILDSDTESDGSDESSEKDGQGFIQGKKPAQDNEGLMNTSLDTFATYRGSLNLYTILSDSDTESDGLDAGSDDDGQGFIPGERLAQPTDDPMDTSSDILPAGGMNPDSFSEEEDSETEVESSDQGLTFTIEDLGLFLQRKRQTLPGLGITGNHFATNLKKVYLFLKDLEEKRNFETFQPTVIALTKAKILTDHRLSYPHDEHKGVLTQLQSYVTRLSSLKGLSHEEKRHLNYARIYCVKILCLLGEYQKAYDFFVGIHRSYTKSSFVDIAEIIINGFVPQGMTPRSVKIYAANLLDGKNLMNEAIVSRQEASQECRDALTKESNRIHRERFLEETRESNPRPDIVNVTHPDYFNSQAAKRRIRVLSHELEGLDVIDIDEPARPSPSSISQDTLEVTPGSQPSRGPTERSSISTSSPARQKVVRSQRAAPEYSQRRKGPNHQTKQSHHPRKTSSFSTSEDDDERLDVQSSSSGVSQEATTPEELLPADTQLFLVDELQDEINQLLVKGYDLYSDRQTQPARDLFKQALKKAKENHFDILEIKGLLALASVGFNGKLENKTVTRVDCYKLAHDLACQVGSTELEVKALNGLGSALFEGLLNGVRVKDADCYKRAYDLTCKLGNLEEKIKALIGLGNVEYRGVLGGKTVTSFDCYKEAYNLACEADLKNEQIRVLIGLGNKKFKGVLKGVEMDRIECFKRAYDLACKIECRKGQMKALLGLGNNCYKGDLNGVVMTPIDCYKKAHAFSRELGTLEDEMRILLGLGNARFKGVLEGQTVNRFNCYKGAYTFSRKLGSTRDEIKALLGLANARFEGRLNGRKVDRFDCYKEAYNLARKIGSLNDEMRALFGLGNAMFKGDLNGEWVTDATCYQRAYDLACKLGSLENEFKSLLGLGNADFKGVLKGEMVNCFDCYQEAYKIARRTNSLKDQIKVLLALGHKRFDGVLEGKELTDKDCYKLAYDLAHQISSQKDEIRALIGLGNSRFRGLLNGESVTDSTCYQRAYDLAYRIGSKEDEFRALIGLGNYEASQRETIQAKTYFEKALSVPTISYKQKQLAQKKIRQCEKFLRSKKTRSPQSGSHAFGNRQSDLRRSSSSYVRNRNSNRGARMSQGRSFTRGASSSRSDQRENREERHRPY